MESERTRHNDDFAELKGGLIAVNLETTGPDPENDRIIGIAALRFNLRRKATREIREVVGNIFDILVNPEIPLPQEAAEVYGIRDADLKDKPKFHEIAQELRDFIGNRMLIGHNISRDKEFLAQEFKRANIRPLNTNKTLCTMERMQKLQGYPGGGYDGDDLASAAQALKAGKQDKPRRALQNMQIIAVLTLLFYRFDSNLVLYEDPAEESVEEGCGTAALVLLAVIIPVILALV